MPSPRLASLLSLALVASACGPSRGAGPALDATSTDATSTDQGTTDGSMASTPDLSPTDVTPPGCVPQTCLSLGYTCGLATDGCGVTLNCGTCAAGYTCGGKGVPSSCGAEYYISPAGLDTNSGTTPTAPWLHFSYAIPKLAPGDTLVLLDGSYTKADSGMLTVDCTGKISTPPAQNGIAGAPITVRAQHARHAFIVGDGTETSGTVLDNGCSYWSFVGLHARSNDALRSGSNATAPVFGVWNAHDVTLYRCLGEYNNRLYNTQVFNLWNTHDSSVIESEAYNYHRHGFDEVCSCTSSTCASTCFASPSATSGNNVFQRDYANATPGGPCDAKGTSKGAVHCGWDLTCDSAGLCGGIPGTQCFCQATGGCIPSWQATQLPRCGWPSHNATLGDEGITQYWSPDGFVENNITLNGEGQQATGVNNLIEGGVSLYEERGVHMGYNTSAQQPDGNLERNNTARNMLVVGPSGAGASDVSIGALLCGNNDTAANLSLLRKSYDFETIGHGASWCQPYTPMGSTPPPLSFTAYNLSIVDPLGIAASPTKGASGGYGAVSLGTYDSWSASYLNVWLSSDPAAITPETPYSPSLTTSPPLWTSSTTLAVTGTGTYDPVTGTGNMVYVPSTSNLKGKGKGGADIGANVTCLWDHGANTGKPMWHSTDGRFAGCDWYTAGSVDDVAASEGYTQTCGTVHTLVNIGTNGGTIPPCMP